jgi:hypothetical protein
VSIEYHIAAFNWDQGSNHLPNGDMEASSYWTNSGDQSSMWYDTSSPNTGARALAFKIANRFVTYSHHLPGGTDTKWDTQLSKNGAAESGAGWGVDAGTDKGLLGRETNYFGHIAYGFFMPNTLAAGTIIEKAHISIKCAQEFSPIARYPRLSKEHTRYLGDAVGSAGYNYIMDCYEVSAQHTPTFVVGSWYYGEGLPYAYDLKTSFQAMVNSRGGVGTSDFINIVLLGNSISGIGVGYAGFYQSSSSVVTSNDAVLDIGYQSNEVSSLTIGDNFILHSFASPRLNPGSSYALELSMLPTAGDNKYKVELLRSDASSILFSSGIFQPGAGQWTKTSFPFSLTGVQCGPLLKVSYAGTLGGALSLIDDVYVGDGRSWGAIGVLQIYPEWEMKRFTKQNRHEHRTKGGKLYSYTWGQYNRFEVPVEYVSNSKASIINSWWATDALIYFKIYSGGVWEVNTCHLMNDSAPLPSLQRPYTNYRKGTLTLETF